MYKEKTTKLDQASCNSFISSSRDSSEDYEARKRKEIELTLLVVNSFAYVMRVVERIMVALHNLCNINLVVHQ